MLHGYLGSSENSLFSVAHGILVFERCDIAYELELSLYMAYFTVTARTTPTTIPTTVTAIAITAIIIPITGAYFSTCKNHVLSVNLITTAALALDAVVRLSWLKSGSKAGGRV